MPDDLREHYLRALMLLRDMFDALALDHLEDAPATVPLRIPVDQLLAWRTRAAALPLEEAGQVWLSELSRASRSDARATSPAPEGGDLAAMADRTRRAIDRLNEADLRPAGRLAAADTLLEVEDALRAHRCALAPSVATPPVRSNEQLTDDVLNAWHTDGYDGEDSDGWWHRLAASAVSAVLCPRDEDGHPDPDGHASVTTPPQGGEDDGDRPMSPSEKALHDAYYDGAGDSERSHDAFAQQRGFASSGELHAWVDSRLAAPQAEGEAASDHRGVGPDGLPLLRLALPMSVELVAAIARGVCEELEPLGYAVHIGDGSQLVARPAERNT